MNRYKGILISLGLCLLAACGNADSIFNGSKVGNEDEFILQYTVLNTTYTHSFDMQEGDAIRCSITSEKGELDICITDENGESIYTGNEAAPATFDVKVENEGIYTISVTGKKASGNVTFERIEGLEE